MQFQSIIIYSNQALEIGEILNIIGIEYFVDFTETNPNLLHIDKPVHSGTIGIDTVRTAQQWVYKKPYSGSHKILIITNSEYLSIESQNSLLKVIEEPPEKTQIVLVADKKERILDTVKSRCIEISHTSETIIKDEFGDIAEKFIREKSYIKRMEILSSFFLE